MNECQKVVSEFKIHIKYDSVINLHLLSCKFSELHKHITPESRPFFTALVGHLARALTVFWKLEIYRTKLVQNDVDWFTYAHTEIEYFFTNIRSALDAFATILNFNSIKKNQLPDSFTQLKNKIDGYSRNLPNGTAELIKSFNDYDSILLIRDEILHRGDDVLVFSGHEDGTLFGLIKSSDKLNSQVDEYFFDGKVINFDRYATYIFCRTFKLFEDYSELLYLSQSISNQNTSRILGVHGLNEMQNIINDIIES